MYAYRRPVRRVVTNRNGSFGKTTGYVGESPPEHALLSTPVMIAGYHRPSVLPLRTKLGHRILCPVNVRGNSMTGTKPDSQASYSQGFVDDGTYLFRNHGNGTCLTVVSTVSPPVCILPEARPTAGRTEMDAIAAELTIGQAYLLAIALR